jgi:CTD small phosphatase-like protein 2
MSVIESGGGGPDSSVSAAGETGGDAAVHHTPPLPLNVSGITVRSHSPHSHSPYRQPTLESHGHAPPSLLDLFSPPAKAPPLVVGDDDLTLTLSHSQSLRRSLTRRASSNRLGTAETLSESTEAEQHLPTTTAGTVTVDGDELDDVLSSNDLATVDAATSQTARTQDSAEQGSSTQTDAAATSADDEDDFDDFDPYLFIAQLPPLPEELRPREAVLPPRKEGDERPTLVLDLDETLVHCSIDSLENADFHFPVVFNDVEYKVYVRQRPHFAQFLRDVIAYGFEVVVFTASQRVYADALLHLLDPRGDLIEHRLFRDSCIHVAGNFIKDLSVLGRDLARVAIIDNSPQTFGYQLDNGIPIESFFVDSSDTKLLQLLPLLRSLSTCADMRPLLREHFQLSQIVEERRQVLAQARLAAGGSTSQAQTQQTQTQTQNQTDTQTNTQT